MKTSDTKLAGEIVASDYSRSAELYEKYVVPNHLPIARRLVRLADLKPGQRVLDVGTGTGIATILAADEVGKSGQVLCIDSAKGMLAIARRKAAKMKLGNVDFQLMTAASLRLPDKSFDVVISNLGTPEVPYDVRLALSEILRVLKKRGRFCFCEFAQRSKIWKMAYEILSKYKVANPGTELKARRQIEELIEQQKKEFSLLYYTEASKVWSIIEEAGFRNVRTLTESFRIRYPSAKEYLDYFLSEQQAEYSAMTPQAQQELNHEALNTLTQFENSQDSAWELREVNFWVVSK